MTILSLPLFARAREKLCLPTKFRSRFRDPEPMVRKFLQGNRSSMPSDFLDYLPDLSPVLVRNKYYPTHFKDVVFENRPASPGLFFRERGFRTQGDVLDSPRCMHLMHYTIHLLKRGLPVQFLSQVCIASSTEDINGVPKCRLVWVQDMTLSYIEKMFAQSILDDIDFTAHVPRASTFHHKWCKPFTYQLDVSSFDASVPSWLIYIAFALIFSRFDAEHYKHHGKVNKRYSLQHLQEVIIHNFIYSRFVTPTNPKVRRKSHGVPSGSVFTNIIDSIVSKLVCNYVIGKQVDDMLIHTYGDDTMFNTCGSRINTELVSITYKSLGFEIRFEEALPNGCRVYCKEWCLSGLPFHPGEWYSNIISCIKDERFLGALIYALLITFSPTPLQAKQLLAIETPKQVVGPLPPWLSYQITVGVSGSLELKD
uniref:RNA-dependent RNA polymerase n=1 Tax=Osugoroshi virus 2 TaxID=2202812 RepID=A0A679B8Z6_9VIRU|nr:RNA-dependent RNA polymerase [Osugoroshi virus 2]